MRKFVPLEKQSKAAQKAYHSQQRNNWGTVNPVARVEKDKTKYDRKRFKKGARELSKEGFLFCCYPWPSLRWKNVFFL